MQGVKVKSSQFVSIMIRRRSEHMSLVIAAILVIHSCQSYPHHGGYHAPGDPWGQDMAAPEAANSNVMKRMGQSAEASPGSAGPSSPVWPSSSSHWADVPTSFGANKDWHQWAGSSSSSSPSQPKNTFSLHADESGLQDGQPFKRHVDNSQHSSFGNDFGSLFKGQGKKPSSYEAPESPAGFESYDPSSEDEEESEEKPKSPTSYEGVQRPSSVSQAFPTGFDQFKESVKANSNPYGGGQQQRPSSTPFKGASSSSSSQDEPNLEEFEEEPAEFEEGAAGGFSSEGSFTPDDSGAFNADESKPQSESNFASNKGSSSFSPQESSFNSQGSSFKPPSSASFKSQDSGSFNPQGSGNFRSQGSSSSFSPPSPGLKSKDPAVFNPSSFSFSPSPSDDAQNQFKAPQFGNRPAPGNNRPERAPQPNSFGAPTIINHGPNSNSQSYSSFGAPSSKPRVNPNVGRGAPPPPPHAPQASSQYDSVKAPGEADNDDDFKEFSDQYEKHNRGVNTEENFGGSKSGNRQKKHQFKNYREPIQRNFDKKPEHESEDFGGNYGAVEAYQGGYSSEKFDPEQYAKDDANNPDPGEVHDEEDEELEKEVSPPVLGKKQQPLRRTEQVGKEEEEEEEKDPEDNEEGYYVPLEARENDDSKEKGEEKEEEKEEGKEETEEASAGYKLSGGKYQELKPAKKQRMKLPQQPQADLPAEVEKEVEEDKDKTARKYSPITSRIQPSS